MIMWAVVQNSGTSRTRHRFPLQLPIGKLCEGTGPDDCSQQTKTTLTTFSSLKKTRLPMETLSHHCRQLPRTNPTENAKISDSGKGQGQDFVHRHRTTSLLCLGIQEPKNTPKSVRKLLTMMPGRVYYNAVVSHCLLFCVLHKTSGFGIQ